MVCQMDKAQEYFSIPLKNHTQGLGLMVYQTVMEPSMKVSQPNGSKFVYTGQISNGQANGQGTLSFTQGPHKGDSYFGPFKNNNFHTEGMFLTVQCYEVQFLSKTQSLTKPI